MDKFPDVLRIEPASICNFRCKHCIVRDKKGELLSRELLEKIIMRWGITPRVVVMYHGGEPLINRNTPFFIRLVKSVGVQRVVMNTNARLLKGGIVDDLLKSGLDELRVSFDGDSPQENDEIRVGGNFERESKNVLDFLDKRRLSRPVVRINNARFINNFEREPDRRIEPAQYLIDTFGERVTYEAYPMRKWAGMEPDEYITVSYDSERPKYCSLLFETMTVKANGDVVPCCEDLLGTVVLGNVNHNSLPEIWNGEKHARFRTRFRKRDYPSICRDCWVVKGTYLV